MRAFRTRAQEIRARQIDQPVQLPHECLIALVTLGMCSNLFEPFVRPAKRFWRSEKAVLLRTAE